ncbi:sensor histidine kinase [Sinomonas mesophila]|uniref:sensor histidine kinase n=1 Tax=Sinomonas mesophila TaxID=1531955 RepID=UPI0009877083|nr:sensor histidine kinase [Sinomonas mesophila]
MRLRVLGILSVVTALIVLAVAASILASASRELTQELQINRAAALGRFAQVAYDSTLDGDSAQLQRDMDRYSSLYGEGLVIRSPTATLTSGGLSPDRPDIAEALARARLNLDDTALSPLAPFGPASETMSRPFGTGSQVLGEAVLDVDLEPARARLRERWAFVALGAVAVWALLLLGAGRVTGWVLRPVHRLTEAVAELGSSGRAAPLPEDGPPELRALSRAFTSMSQTVAESLESQRQFIADAAHQLRNPVGALRLRTDLLGLELATEAQREAAGRASGELDRVESVLADLLRLAAAEHRASELAAPAEVGAPGPLDPYPVLAEAVEHAGPEARRVGVELRLAGPPPEPLRIRCDEGDLAEMAGELIGNALKYAPGARVTVSARAGGGIVSVEVADDGPGLSADERSAATTRFWRSPRHQGIQGTGLGMAIVERLAGANGARLDLAPVEPHGLVARLDFPEAGPGKAAPGGAAPRKAAPGEAGP